VKLLTFSLILLLSTSAKAEFLYLGRSQEGLLMGDAYTAVADDETTLFYNPAAMGRHSGVSIYPLNPSFQVPNLLELDIGLSKFNVGMDDRFDNWPKDPAGIADRVLGYPVYFHLGATPTIKMQHFAFTMFAVSKTNMVLENAIHPTLDIAYRYDRGFMFGYAYTFGRGGGKKGGDGNQFSLGFGLKSMNRQGLEGSYDLFGTQLLEIINNAGDFKDIRRELGYSKGSALGFDLGIENSFKSAAGTLTLGASLLDIGDTKFSKDEGIEKVPEQEMSLNFGSAYTLGFSDLAKATFALDFHNALDASSSVASKFHLGGRLNLPFLDLYTGWNGGYSSLGVGLDLFLFRVMVGYYGIEIGSEFREKEAKRAVISLNLLNIAVDL
jgi:hypothetical protein